MSDTFESKNGVRFIYNYSSDGTFAVRSRGESAAVEIHPEDLAELFTHLTGKPMGVTDLITQKLKKQ